MQSSRRRVSHPNSSAMTRSGRLLSAAERAASSSTETATALTPACATSKRAKSLSEQRVDVEHQHARSSRPAHRSSGCAGDSLARAAHLPSLRFGSRLRAVYPLRDTCPIRAICIARHGRREWLVAVPVWPMRETLAHYVGSGLDAVLKLQLLERVVDMVLDRALGDRQCRANLLVGQAVGDILQRLELTPREDLSRR